MDAWQPVYVGVGSNLDAPLERVREAVRRLGELPRTRVVTASPAFGSRPFGPVAQPDFVNGVAALLSQLPPEEMLAGLKGLERAMGRSEVHEKWGPRVIDLDLLVHGRERRDRPDFTLPHPGIVERNFVLYPLAAIAPDLDVPGLGRAARLRERVAADGIWPLNENIYRHP